MGAIFANKFLQGLGNDVAGTSRTSRGRQADKQLGVLAFARGNLCSPLIIREFVTRSVVGDSITHGVVVELDKEGVKLGLRDQFVVLVSKHDTLRGGSDEHFVALLTPPVDHGNIGLVAYRVHVRILFFCQGSKRRCSIGERKSY